MAGGIKGAWGKVTDNIRLLSKRVYTSVGIVLTPYNKNSVVGIIDFADSLGVSDIRVIPAAQNDQKLEMPELPNRLLDKYPILKYRYNNITNNKPVRGVNGNDSHKCGLVLDDMVVNHGKHYPCVIYFREGGKEIGCVGKEMRKERLLWMKNHDSSKDSICSKNCLDVCVDYNNKYEGFRKKL
jgi:hypothetical protein